MLRHLAGETDAVRQRLRDQVLATTAQDFTTFAAILDQVKQQGAVVVLGSEQAITAAEAERRLGLQVTKVL